MVFLADLNRSFNRQDLDRPVLVHPQLGVGAERVEVERRLRYDTVSKTALALTLGEARDADVWAEQAGVLAAELGPDDEGVRAALLAEFPDAVIEAEQREISAQEGTETAAVTYIFTANIAAPP